MVCLQRPLAKKRFILKKTKDLYIFREDRMRFESSFTQKQAFGLELRSPFAIFAACE
jgi:hypothetical protein